MQIIGRASTILPGRFIIIDDERTEDLSTGVATFTCKLLFDHSAYLEIDGLITAGNYILTHTKKGDFFYTIIESDGDSSINQASIYAEDAGLDLLNEVVDAYEASEAHNIAWYFNKFTSDSGFEIGVNQIASRTRTLKWESEATVTDRLLSLASSFNAELSYSFGFNNFAVIKKYVNFYSQRGNNNGVILRKGQSINKITKKRSIAQLATAIRPKGGTPSGSDNPITLSGYSYDDGDIYLSGKTLISRSARAKWTRYQSPFDTGSGTGAIVQLYSYDTTSQATLCSKTVAKLKSIMETEEAYEVEFVYLPDDIGIGDTVTIIDGENDVYFLARITQLVTSETGQNKATIQNFTSAGSNTGDHGVNIGILNSNVNTLNMSVNNLDDRVSENETDISALETKMGTATLNTTATKVTNAINELLNDINGTLTTYAPSSSITNSRGQLRVLKQGNVVYLAGGIGNITSTVGTGTNLFTALGSSYRPSSNVTIQGWVNDAMANFTVRSDGYIRQTLSSACKNCFFVGYYKV